MTRAHIKRRPYMKDLEKKKIPPPNHRTVMNFGQKETLIKTCKCHNLKISRDLRCTPEMIELCKVEDGIECDGFGQELS